MKEYIGKNRTENLKWLTDVWLNVGPPVCFLQGFSGVGKTDLARDFRELAEKLGMKPAVINEIADRPTPNVIESLMELSLVLSQQGLPEMEQVLFEQKAPNLAFALERVLQRKVVIILDEAQRFFHPKSGAPVPEMNGVLAFLRNRQNLPGRLLLLSDRIVEEARWSEWIPKRTLTKLEPEEAIIVLNTRLKESGVEAEISEVRKKEVIRDLDFNPRAIEALVGALRYDTLDEIIKSNPGLWDVRDREISREFLRALERDLLERTMKHLDQLLQQKLWRLAVHRRSFKREALDKLCANNTEASELRSILLTRYLLNSYKGMLALNPIVREISLDHLRQTSEEFKQAHSAAAEYHLRHFKAKQIVGTQSKLGESFAELRYHFVQAGREADLSLIGQRFTDYLKQQIKSVSPVPSDREELDERIGVLKILLGDGGAKGLEYHLARCLAHRGKHGDLDQAINHAHRALDRGIADSWVLCADLLSKVGKIEGDDGAVALLKKGIEVITPDKNLFSLYQIAADLLSKVGKIEGDDGAVALLKKGIEVITPDKNLFSLYQIAADLLSKVGKIEGDDGAVALLKKGIEVIPPDKSLSSLYQILAEVHCRAGHVAEAIESLREGLSHIPTEFGRHRLEEDALYLCAAIGDTKTIEEILASGGNDAIGPQAKALGTALQCQMKDDWKGAAETAGNARQQFPRNIPLLAIEAFSLLAVNDDNVAWAAMSSYPNLVFDTGNPLGWLATFIHLRRGALSDALVALTTYLGRSADESRELNERFLLRLWDQQVIAPKSRRLCFHFPIMPASLSGLSKTVCRVQFGAPVFTPQAAPIPDIAANALPTTATLPEIYVSYAWGEDSTEAGRQREEIVDRLCDAVQRSGRVIGRDKDRMRGGDSIERFAHEISKAKRIVAVISEKSLHSEFCMAHELFRAFRRCDYQRTEFQEKVIAVVMDDAKPLLRDNLTLVALAKAWRERMEKLRTELQSVDPTRKSPALWIFVDMMEDMCPRLPDMLGALKDIVMKRGFDEIVADGFKQIIDRLPEEDRRGVGV
ncbi:MAG: toll/interleukin-1 receptor domain-containing protein [Thermodesulfobacteriota bacterium]